ncbi:iron-containing alcohol dehydrogenase [Thermaerobacter subterraneus]|uniref:Glycerol dehydrogenase-like oxidoreductase n=1 Tax=Thermaerobacter subterraneus DSM 13965 TaxID=867903 RepID=K6PMQ8_9FIRM|nr:iron-containing alcohol dehydrogenase [Thermaerobacter subterraneus]EKP94177.1 glycerol dehydrogenase-like oxidoreductase [Thermaerobacter subterraneus DSM 13965]
MRPARRIEVSRVLKVVESTAEAARRLAEALDLLGVTRAVVLAGPGRTRLLAEALLADLARAGWGHGSRAAGEPAGGDGFRRLVGPWVAAAPTQAESARLAAAVREVAADGLVAIGGGSVLDTGKHVAAQLDLPLVAVPTQISHDGIVSPVAVLRGDDNRKHSLAAAMPAAVIAPLHWIGQAPRAMVLAGIGDLLSNLSAVEDWRLAADRGRDQFDDFSAFLARHAARSVLRVLAAGQAIDDPAFVVELLEGLMLSGLAMAIAGTSRPCSGSEHLVSHAIDYLLGGVAAHGLQVAAATAPMLRLQGQDELAREVEAVYRRLGIPGNLAALGLDQEAIARVVAQAPAMRPGRFTVLDVVEPAEAVRWLHG